MAIPWNDDPPGSDAKLRVNLQGVLRRLIEEADRRDVPSVDEARRWHREIFEGVELPVPYYAGEVRNEDPRFPELVDYEVMVGRRPGVAARRVHEALDRFETNVRSAVAILDPVVPVGEAPGDRDALGSVVTLCALVHGEWARIHPFANGNGRTARLWANWCALRYGLPPFVRFRPRPAGHAYARAAVDSMAGDHRAAVSLFMEWVEGALGAG